MKYLFEDPEKQKELKVSIDSWIGTPYRHWCGVKGLGCDCIHFVVRVLEEVGLGPFPIYRYPKDWHLHNDDELLLTGLRKHLKANEFDIYTEPLNGDLVLYKFGKTFSHSAIYFDGYVYQSLNNIGVERRNWLDDQWRKRLALIMRILS